MTPPLGLFEGYGIELEYMLVRRDTLDVLPVADRLLAAAAGRPTGDYESGPLAWSNELALHLIELKTNGPAPRLDALPAVFAGDLARIEGLLAPLDGRLMPGAMHPWMDPRTELKLWPQDDEIYRIYDRIFDSRGHGWANLQSMHINLPFAGDAEFARLHAAVRLLLPILPALAASSPFADAASSGAMDRRLEVYRRNQERIPEIAGDVVPETVSSRVEYEERILWPMYRAIAPHDPQGVLQEEWLNSRGAIARFDRNAIEIRVLDTQEHPRADLACAALVAAVLRALATGRWRPLVAQQAMPQTALVRLFEVCVREADEATIRDADYLAHFGVAQRARKARDLWWQLAETVLAGGDQDAPAWHEPLETIFRKGVLARRILRAAGDRPSRDRLHAVYTELCECLRHGRSFGA